MSASSSAAARAPGRPVTRNAQCRYIIANANLLDRPTKLQILRLITMEQEDGSIMESGRKDDVDIDLSRIESPDLIRQIYNLVEGRRRALSKPARSD